MPYRLRMPAQIGDWLADLRATEPLAAAEVGATLIVILDASQVTGLPFVRHAVRVADIDPREVLDYSYQWQLEELQKVRRRVADVAIHRAAVEEQLAALRERPDRDAAALEGLEQQAAKARREEQRLGERSRQLQARVDAFRTRKETIKASYTAAEAQARIADAFEELERVQAQAERLSKEQHSGSAPNETSPTERRQQEFDEAVPHQPAGHDEDGARVQQETVVKYQSPSTNRTDAPKSDPGRTTETSNDVGETRRPEPAGPEDRFHRPANARRRPRLAADSDVWELTADPLGADIRILFAIEPADTITLLTVLEGADAVFENRLEALDVAGELLDEIRTASAGPTTNGADDDWIQLAGSTPFLDQFFADAGDVIAKRAAELASVITLAKLRQRRGMTLKDLARATGIDEHRLAAIERGGPAQADLSELGAILRQLGDRLELIVLVDGKRLGLG